MKENKRRPKAENPKGFRDYSGDEVRRRNRLLRDVAGVYDLYGFEPLETPAVETVEALGKFLPDVERPNAGVFAWRDETVSGLSGGDWLALRYDLTAPLARFVAQFRNDLAPPYRRYSSGPVWRNENPGPGRFRQFYQIDADIVGAKSVQADAEILDMLSEAFTKTGLSPTDYEIKISSRKVLNGVLEIAEIGDGVLADNVLRCVDKLDKVGLDGVRLLLTTGRKDESGAFIEGLGLSEEKASVILGFLSAKGESDANTVNNLRGLLGTSSEGAAGVQDLEDLLMCLSGQSRGTCVIDPSVVRGLGYYTGIVFEADLTFEVKDDKGRSRRFGSVAGGGRYDDLIERFTGQKLPATGVSIGVDRLLAALSQRGRARKTMGPVVIAVMNKEDMTSYREMAASLRSAGVRAEVYCGNQKGVGDQMKYANKRGSRFCVIQGEDERGRGVVQVKDLFLGTEMSKTASLEEWRRNPSQEEVPVERLSDYLVAKINLDSSKLIE